MPNLKFWDNVIKQNVAISPIVIAKVPSRKTFAALFDTYGINYPYVFDDNEEIRKLNDTIQIGEVVLIDRTGLILTRMTPYRGKASQWYYTKFK